MEKLISVIIPVYNVEAYLGRCLDSVISNSYRNLEIICVDDGSTDGSGAICDSYAEKDERIRVIHKQNGRVAAARNAGLDVCRGEYISFVDADDWIHKDFYRIMSGILEEAGADIAVCGFVRSTDKDSLPEDVSGNWREISRFKLLSTFGLREFVWNKLYRKEAVGNVHFRIGQKIEDIPFNTDVVRAGKNLKIALTEDRLYSYYIREDSLVTDLKPEAYLELCDFYYDSILEETDADMRECLAVECARRALHGTGFESVAKERELFKRHTDMAKKCLPYIREKRLEYTVFSYCPRLRNFLRRIKDMLRR